MDKAENGHVKNSSANSHGHGHSHTSVLENSTEIDGVVIEMEDDPQTGNFIVLGLASIKSKITKILNSEENSFGKSLITWQNQMTKHIKRLDNNCHIPELVQAFSNVENDGLNLVL